MTRLRPQSVRGQLSAVLQAAAFHSVPSTAPTGRGGVRVRPRACRPLPDRPFGSAVGSAGHCEGPAGVTRPFIAPLTRRQLGPRPAVTTRSRCGLVQCPDGQAGQRRTRQSIQVKAEIELRCQYQIMEPANHSSSSWNDLETTVLWFYVRSQWSFTSSVNLHEGTNMNA